MKKLYKEKLNKKEKSIVTRAFILRHAIFIALIFSDSLIKMCVCILCYGIVFLISALTECEEFYCAMMDINHISMKPYKCSYKWRKNAYKEGVQVSILFIITGILGIIAGIYFQ